MGAMAHIGKGVAPLGYPKAMYCQADEKFQPCVALLTWETQHADTH